MLNKKVVIGVAVCLQIIIIRIVVEGHFVYYCSVNNEKHFFYLNYLKINWFYFT